jgi:hypothetical protein
VCGLCVVDDAREVFALFVCSFVSFVDVTLSNVGWWLLCSTVTQFKGNVSGSGTHVPPSAGVAAIISNLIRFVVHLISIPGRDQERKI